jgi:hypothetical protein
MRMKKSVLIETHFLQLLNRTQPTIVRYYGTHPSVDAVVVKYSVKKVRKSSKW